MSSKGWNLKSLKGPLKRFPHLLRGKEHTQPEYLKKDTDEITYQD